MNLLGMVTMIDEEQYDKLTNQQVIVRSILLDLPNLISGIRSTVVTWIINIKVKKKGRAKRKH